MLMWSAHPTVGRKTHGQRMTVKQQRQAQKHARTCKTCCLCRNIMHTHPSALLAAAIKKRKYCPFWRQFDTKPSIILGCPSAAAISIAAACIRASPLLLGRLAAARLRQTGLSARCPCCLGTQTGTGSWQRCCCLGDTDLCTANGISESVALQSGYHLLLLSWE